MKRKCLMVQYYYHYDDYLKILDKDKKCVCFNNFLLKHSRAQY